MRFVLAAAALAAFALAAPLRAGVIGPNLDSKSTDEVLQNVLRLPVEATQQAKARVFLEGALEQFRQGDFDGTLQQLNAAVESLPGLPPARLMLARLFLATGQIPQGRVALEQAATASPDDPNIYLIFGDLALLEGRVTDAELHFRQAQRLLPKDQTAVPDPQARKRQTQIHAGLAAVAEQREQWQQAAEALTAWLALEPAQGAARQRLGRSLFQLKRYKEASDALAQAVLDEPGLEPAAISMGRLYHEAGDAEKAQQWMEHAVKKEPQNARAHLAVALWRLEIDQPQEAQQALEMAAKLDPNLPDLERLRGVFARHRQDYAVAERYLQALFNENPGDFGAANQLVLTLIEQEDEAKRRRAVQLAEVNARQYPNSAEALATLGWVYYRLNRLDEAERLLQAAVSGGHVSSEVAYYLAHVLHAHDRTEEAQAVLVGAVQTPGLFPQREAARQFLGTLRQQVGGEGTEHSQTAAP